MMNLNLNMKINKRQRRMWIARHRKSVERFWTITLFLLFFLVLGVVGKMEFETCLRGGIC